MSQNLSNRRWRDILLKVARYVIGPLVGFALGLAFYYWKEHQTTIKVQREAPEIELRQAERDRRGLTEVDLASAVKRYEDILHDLDKNTSLDAEMKRRYQGQTFSGLGRSYADWTMRRDLLGLSRSDYPERARSNALEGFRIAPDLPETGIALAYAYDSVESESSDKAATRAKVNELLATGIDSLDLQYIAWSSGASNGAETFPKDHRAAEISELRILVDVGLASAMRADQVTSTEKQMYLERGSEYVDRAAQLAPDNAIVLFARGRLSAAKDNKIQARDFYQKAVDREPEFPRARNNLGFTYAWDGDYKNAKNQFQASVQGVGAPITSRSLRTRLDNFAYACLELVENTNACQAWKQASEIPGAEEAARTFIGLAMCDYTSGKKDAALTNFRRAVQLNKKPIDISYFEQEKAGPKELEIARALIQMAK